MAFDQGFFNRLRSSADRILFGLDLLLAAGIGLISYCSSEYYLTEGLAIRFFTSTTPLITTLLIVIVTSVSILVSLSNSDAITQLKQKQLYGGFLFTFEFTAILALFTVLISIIARTFNFEIFLFHLFVFLVSYTVFAVGTVISRLITYGDKIAQISLTNELPDDLGSRVTEIHPEDGNDDSNESPSNGE